MSPSVTLVTSHALDGPESEARRDEQRRFAEFVAAHEPRLLDFQAYVNDDRSELKLMFVFPDVGPGTPDAEQTTSSFQDSRLAGAVAGAVIAALFLAAVYIGSVGTASPA